MAARFGRTALLIKRPGLFSTRVLIPNPPWTSLRCFSQSTLRLERKKANHHDLRSYLEYAKKSGVDQTSNVFKGTKYEYLVIDTLKSYGLELNSIGRRGDRGKDFEGVWKLHKHTKKQPNVMWVIGQCKARKVGPKEVRELDGTSSGNRECTRLLVSNSKSSKGTSEAIQASSTPMAFLQVTEDGDLVQCFWNSAAAEAGLGRLGTTMRYGGRSGSRGNSSGSGSSTPLGTIALTWAGKLWRPRVRKGIKTAVKNRKITKPRAAKRIVKTQELPTLGESGLVA